MTRPNILLITTDQQRWDALSLLGTPGYRTPHLDRLAAEGVLFGRCYTSTPICTPARISLITGQYPTRHGAFSIGMPPVPALNGPTLPRLLSAAGYATMIAGKTHFVARPLEHRHVAGWDLNRTEEPDEAFWEGFDGPYLGFDQVRHCNSHTNSSAPSAHYRRWLNARGARIDHLHGIPGDHKHNQSLSWVGRWELDPQLTQNAWVAEEALGWIARQGDRPWFCMANFQDPHPPYVCPEPYYSAVDMAGVSLGDPAPDYLDDRPAFYRKLVERQSWDDHLEWGGGPEISHPNGRMLPSTTSYGSVGDAASAIRAYIGMVTMVDDYIGRILDDLARRNAAENTLVLFTSDHGELLGRHGLWWKGLPAFDDSQRVPCIMRWPAQQRRPLGRSSALCSLVDFMPTALDAAGITVPPGTQGTSQLPVLRGTAETVRDWVLVDNLAAVDQGFPAGERDMHQQTLIADGWKLVCYRHDAAGELYCLDADPDQRRNRWSDPAARDDRERMLLRLVHANMHGAGTMPERVAMA